MLSPTDAFRRTYCFLATPNLRKFFIYLGLLWILNAADAWQTMALKYGGHLAAEANLLMDHVLAKGPLYFISFKLLAVLLISLVLIRGYLHNNGLKVGNATFDPEQVKTAIMFLLVCAIVYYLAVVFLPLIIIVTTFNPPEEVAHV